MTFICNSFQVRCSAAYQDYSALNTYVSNSGVDGLLLGEDASDFMAFYAIEVHQPFTGERFRIGMILDNHRNTPFLCPIHGRASLAIGLNNDVQVLNLCDHSISTCLKLDTSLHHLLCNGRVLVAIHELGASVMLLTTFHEIANIECDVVADAFLSDEELVLVSMDEETTRIDLTAVVRNVT